MKPTSRKLVIVAIEHITLYKSMKDTLGAKGDVEIVFDRRRGARTKAAAGKGVKKVFSRDLPPGSPLHDRRRPPAIDEQLRRQGWAFVHQDADGLHLDPAPALPSKKLQAVSPAPDPSNADRVGTVLLDHDGVCFDCLAEQARMTLNDVMSSVRRMQVSFLLAFTTRKCQLCGHKALVGYVRDRFVLAERHR
jgi:hypothetical protein